MPTETLNEEDMSIQDRLRRHFRKHTRQVDGEPRLDFLRFAYTTEFSVADSAALAEESYTIPDPEDLVDEYAEKELSELRALHEHAREAKRTYYRRLQAVIQRKIDVGDEQIRRWWWQFCQIIARDHAVEQLLTSATIHGPDTYEDEIDKVLDRSNSRRVPEQNTTEEIAAKILDVLDSPPADWPDSTSKLLGEVDDRRGVKKRTTYRYLHEKMGDSKPDTMFDWKQWAEDKV